MIEIKNKLWIIELKERRLLFDKKEEAILEWKKLVKDKELKLNEMSFSDKGIEYGSVSWSEIALALAKGEIQ